MNKLTKRIIAMIMAIAVIIVNLITAYAEKAETQPIDIKAKAAILVDVSTGKVLMKYNENERLYPASVTKIMSLLLVIEAIDAGKIKLTDKVSASTTAAGKGGSQIWLKEGEQMTVEELLKATAVYSANDACTALGELVAGSDEAFVAMMNSRAEELGMTNTHFENCTGLDDTTTDHLTTAADIAKMSVELLHHELITRYTTIWMDSLRNGQTELVNTNKLIRFYEGATGLKTGTTSKAGCCISASAMRNGTHLVAVVLGSSNSNDRFETAKAMLNWGFANYCVYTPNISRELVPDVRVTGGVEEKITPVIPEIKSILIKKGTESEINCVIDLAADVCAPVEKGQVLGTAKFLIADEVVGEYKFTSQEAVGKLTFSIIFFRILKQTAVLKK